MKTISTSELRSKTSSLVRILENGKPVGLTHRGHRLASIFPVRQPNGISANDPPVPIPSSRQLESDASGRPGNGPDNLWPLNRSSLKDLRPTHSRQTIYTH
jgi:antitoxin (DNA-binding transcriptional repressor) of toxin-antitoxin stability system